MKALNYKDPIIARIGSDEKSWIGEMTLFFFSSTRTRWSHVGLDMVGCNANNQPVWSLGTTGMWSHD